MKCPDCKGSGEYRGFNITPEVCQRCKGLGALDAKGMPDVPKTANSNLPEWMEDYKDQIEVDQPLKFRLTDEQMEQLKRSVKKSIPTRGLLPKLETDDIIHVYDAGWHKAKIHFIAVNPCNNTPEIIYAYTPCDKFRIPYTRLGYNVTEKRWEYIKAGTPVWS